MGMAADFLALHVKGAPLLLGNAWDRGSARILAHLGFGAIATSSAAFAMTLGRRDYGVSRAEAIAHGGALAQAVNLPVSADLENGFGSTAKDAAETVALAAGGGLAGGSIEDFSGDAGKPILDLALAAERITAAAEAARMTPGGFVLTARAEGFLHGEKDLASIIRRLNAFEAAGADVLFAPGLPSIEAVVEVCRSVGKPVNVMISPRFTKATLAQLAQAGVARISFGAGLFFAAYGALHDAAAAARAEGRFEGVSAGYSRANEINAAMPD